jgi:cytochrome c-type biogenesis protein CcmH
MSIFWAIATTLSLLALAFVLPPLLRRNHAPRATTGNQINTEVARQRLAELDQDLATGRLDQARYATARADLERELLNDLKQEDAAAHRPVHSGRWAALLIAVALPVCAVALYKVLGSEQIITLLQQQPAADPGSARAANGMTVEEMVTRLATRLKQDPDNLQGWTMLAKSYSVLERFDLAVPAYRNVMRLGGGKNAGVLADFADALVATSDGKFSAETGQLLTEALQLDPENVKALWLAGHWKHQAGDTSAALEYWEHAARLLPANGEDRRIIRRQIAQARQEAGLPPLAETRPASNAAAGGGTSLQVKVALDPSLRDKVAPDDTVFIYARAASGPPMPLAIARKQVKDLPLTVTLDDSMAMAPGMNLSRFPELTVGARISKSGNAMPQSGDLQGLKSPVRPAATHSLDVLIDQVVGSKTPVGAAASGAPSATPAAAGGGASLQVKVALDPSLRDKAAPDDTVFIYARAASGPPMPLAIIRKQVKDLPLTVTLDDSRSMAPGMVMSRFPELTVGARISKSGNAMPQSGDLQGLKTPVRPAATPDLNLVINQVVP